VNVDPLGHPEDALECKWSDAASDDPRDIAPLIEFAKRHGIESLEVTSRTREYSRLLDGLTINIRPASLLVKLYGDNARVNLAHGSRLELDRAGLPKWSWDRLDL
jgi:hypothetical protein